MIVASVVFPRPGGPTSRTWSSASPRAFAACSAMSSCSFDALLPDELVQSPRPQRLLDLLVSLAENGCQELAHSRSAPERFAHSLLRGQIGIDRGQRLLRLDERVSELDEGIARDELSLALGAGRRHGLGDRAFELEDDALRRLLADAGNRLEPGGVAEGDRTLELLRRSARDDSERDLRPDPADAEQLDEQRSLGRVRESVELQWRPRARAGTSRR